MTEESAVKTPPSFRNEAVRAARREALYAGYTHVAQEEHPEAFRLCICGEPRWRHPANEADRKAISWSTLSSEVPHHLFIEPVLDGTEPTERDGSVSLRDPVIVDMAEALRCTTHIENRGLRAAYLVTDLRLRGYVILCRLPNGRLAKPDAEG